MKKNGSTYYLYKDLKIEENLANSEQLENIVVRIKGTFTFFCNWFVFKIGLKILEFRYLEVNIFESVSKQLQKTLKIRDFPSFKQF